MRCPRCNADNHPQANQCFHCGLFFNRQNQARPPQRNQQYPQQRQQAYAPAAYPQGYQPDSYYDEPAEKKKSITSLIAFILGVLALIVEYTAASGSMNSAETSAEQVGTAIGLAIVLPSIIMLVIAVILNLIGFLVNNRVITLISAIFYTLAFFLFFLWGFVAIPSMILQFVAYAKMKKV